MYQRYTVETIFLNLATGLGIQRSCLENKIGNMDVSYYQGYMGCVNGFLETIGEILAIRDGGYLLLEKNSCILFQIIMWTWLIS